VHELDVVVAGAGPAGSAAAIALARAGRRVLLADLPPARAPALKIGETLPAVTATVLRDLGLLDAFEHAGVAIASTATSAAWGGGEALRSDAIGDPHGHGWHVDRLRFDAWLRDQASAAGAECCCGRVTAHHVDAPSPRRPRGGRDGDSGAGWQVRIGAPASRTLDCRRLIDATGRGAAVARAQGARRERHDRLVAIYARLVAPDDDVDGVTRVASTPDGWWYSALVGAQRRVVAFLTDADLLDPVLRSPAGFAAALAATGDRLLPRRPGGADLELGPAATPAHSARLTPVSGDGWLAVGDAAVAFDPLSSQGILNALVTGLLGATAVDASLRGEPAALAAYARRLTTVWSSYESNRRAAYALERRWPSAPFWARRTAGQPSGDPTYAPQRG
jgi:flavin-dependent dehydrogenase